MRLVSYDCEVFKYDWVVVFKDKETGAYTVIHNDNEALKMAQSDELLNVGFNSKHYDKYIKKGIIANLSPQEVKHLSDYIIDGGQGWEYPPLQDTYIDFNDVDIRDDMQKGLSLKAIAGHLGLPILESSVDFNIDRPLTKEELEETIIYCKNDVDITEKIIELRIAYLKTKGNLGKRANIDVIKAMSLTNAKLTAKMLGAKRKEWSDGREYVYPENLNKSVIPSEIIDFFNTIYDKNIQDEKLFKTSLSITLGGMPCTYAWGGVHGSLLTYHEKATDSRVIQNRDVASLYPTLIEEYGYLSRNVADPNIYYQMKKDRLTAKHNVDKQTANDLKSPLNTVSGAQENKFNDLYDPLSTRSLRISGQLFLTVLAMRLVNRCSTIKLLNFNTDGLMYSVDKYELTLVDEICKEWEKETRFELETEEVDRVWIKDVNNLLMVKTDGEIKKVGGYLNYGISMKGAWSINNNMIIVKKALVEYFVNNVPIEDTINNCDDIFQFQLIAKAGTKYKEAYHLVDGEKTPVQKVNRVYASKDTRYGKLFKVKAEDDSTAMIESLPNHCVIDNNNELDISDVDKSFYIEIAKKRVNDYLGIKTDKKERTKMAAKKAETIEAKIDFDKLNIYQKLNLARELFLNTDVQKSGKNMHLSFKYFELDDIVPVATRIFNQIGIIGIANFTDTVATLTIINTSNPEDTIFFTAPFNQLKPIVSNAGKQATNEMQALGSSITYMRRYLYMMALDICESDSIDSEIGKPVHLSKESDVPATPEKREEIKENLTNPTDNASPLQIKGLKSVLKKLKEADPSKEELLAKLAVETQGFTVISKEDCEKLIKRAHELLGEVES